MKEIDPKTKQFFISLGISIAIISLGMNLIQFFFGQSLDNQIELRNMLISEKDSTFSKIINDQKINDSLYRSYIGPGAIEIGEDSVNFEELIKLTSDFIARYNECRDSVIIYRNLLKILDDKYGKNFNIVNENGVVQTTKLFNKGDTALLLYKYYKDKVTIDKNGNMNIDGPPIITIDKNGNTIRTVERHVLIPETIKDTTSIQWK